MTSVRHTASVSDDELLDAAREVILSVGWRRATLTEIARRAGVSRMTLYRRWPDTQTLLSDLMAREWAAALGGSVSHGVDDDAELRRRLVDGVVTAVAQLRDNALFRKIVEVDPERLLPYVLQRLGRSQLLALDVLATEIRRGQRAGQVRKGRPAHLARSVLLAAQGFALSADTVVVPATREADLRRLDRDLARMLDGLLAP